MIIEGMTELSMYAFILEMVLEKEGWNASQIEKLRKKFCPNTNGFIEICYNTSTIYDEIKKYIDSKLEENESQGNSMTINESDQSVHDILMCVIGEALMEADASFMFGHDFGPIIDKWSPLLQKKNKFKTKMYRADIHEIKQLVAGANASTPFVGDTHPLIQDRLDNLESEICE